MNRTRHNFTRHNGEKLTVELTVDPQALALFMSQRLTRHGSRSQRKTVGGGAAVLTVITDG